MSRISSWKTRREFFDALAAIQRDVRVTVPTTEEDLILWHYSKMRPIRLLLDFQAFRIRKGTFQIRKPTVENLACGCESCRRGGPPPGAEPEYHGCACGYVHPDFSLCAQISDPIYFTEELGDWPDFCANDASLFYSFR